MKPEIPRTRRISRSVPAVDAEPEIIPIASAVPGLKTLDDSDSRRHNRDLRQVVLVCRDLARSEERRKDAGEGAKLRAE